MIMVISCCFSGLFEDGQDHAQPKFAWCMKLDGTLIQCWEI